MRGTLAAAARAVGIGTEARSTTLGRKAERLRARLVKLDDGDNADRSALAAALPRLETELLEEVPDGAAAREVADLRARLAMRDGERKDIVALVEKLEGEATAARAEEEAEQEESRLVELGRLYGEQAREAVELLAPALVAMGKARTIEGAWLLAAERFGKKGGAIPPTEGLSARNIIARATGRAVQLAPSVRFQNPTGLVIEITVPTFPPEDVPK